MLEAEHLDTEARPPGGMQISFTCASAVVGMRAFFIPIGTIA